MSSSRVVPLGSMNTPAGHGSMLEIYRSQLSLLPLMTATLLLALPLFRLGSAADLATRRIGLGISYGVSYLPLVVIPLWVYTHVAPRIYTTRTLVKLLSPVVAVLAFLRGAQQALIAREGQRDDLTSQGNVLEDAVQIIYNGLHPLFVLTLPFLFSRFSLRTPLAKYQMEGASSRLLSAEKTALGFLMTFVTCLLYFFNYMTYWAGWRLGVLNFIPIGCMLVGILIDRRHSNRGSKDTLYALTCGFLGLSLSTGAVNFVFITVPISHTLPTVLRAPASLVFFTLLFSILRLQLTWVFKRLVKDPQLWSPLLFGLQLIEDLMMEVLYVGVAVNSASFWVVLFFSILKQVLRDSFLVHLGWIRLKGIITGHKVTLQQQRAHLANSWRVLEQNLASELLSACVLPIMLLLDLMYREAGVPGDDVVIASMPTASAVVEQVGAYVLLLCGELAVHAITHWLILSRVAALQEPSAVYAAGDVEDAKSESGVKGEGVSGSWTLTVEGYRCETAAYWAQHRWMLSVIAVATTWEVASRLTLAVDAVTQ
eukprot:PLAT3282.1.p1 GENE.PLAT3282.1~~PLAT3282.1.p1  ORF type:complete len:540 (+),score=154.16 PLAT3282.1:101-1720(+)